MTCIDLTSDDFSCYTLLGHHIVFSMYEDEKKSIWIGTSDGLFCWKPEEQELTNYTIKDGLPCNTVYGIQGDGQGGLWISTNAGIAQLHKENRQFINYYVSDGLQGNEFTKNASLRDANGTLWFGGMNGVTYFNPQEITNPEQEWNIRITDFYLHNHPVKKGMLSGGHEIIDRPVFEAESFHLSYKDNSFSIEFSTLELNSPERIVYYYAMNDDKWAVLPAGTNRVSFSNLSPGTYRFRVKAVDYMTESNVKAVTIYISPAWWATRWAWLLYFVVAAGCILYIALQVHHRYRIRQEMVKHRHAEQINEAKLQFFINISHEIRTPMSLIISPLQKLISSDSDIRRQKTYNIIYRNAERILRLINQLMDIRKIDKGQMVLTFRRTDIIPFIGDLCDTFAQPAEEKKITLSFHHLEGDTQELWIDPANFDKVILNLLSNAFKFTPEGGKVDISLYTKEDMHVSGPLRHYVEIVVADSGIGIPAQEVEHIFDRFYQIDQMDSTDASKTGTGIGLALTKGIVELHHGTIRVESELGKGSSFIVNLQLGNAQFDEEQINKNADSVQQIEIPKPENDALLKAELEESAPIKRLPDAKILIVEDNDSIRDMLAGIFKPFYEVLTAADGAEGLALVRSEMPNIVVSDVVMPNMSGTELCKQIKSDFNTCHIPVVLLTARTAIEQNIEGLRIGADDYITKPFNTNLLISRCNNLVNSRILLQEKFSKQPQAFVQMLATNPIDKEILDRAMAVIEQHLDDTEFNVNVFAREMAMARTNLFTKLKAITGQTPNDFILTIRLKKGALMLRNNPELNITEIADRIGFSSSRYFSKCFKDIYHVSPLAYRKGENGGEESTEDSEETS